MYQPWDNFETNVLQFQTKIGCYLTLEQPCVFPMGVSKLKQNTDFVTFSIVHITYLHKPHLIHH